MHPRAVVANLHSTQTRTRASWRTAFGFVGYLDPAISLDPLRITSPVWNMESILEQQRRYHEEKERLMDAKTKEVLHKKSTVSVMLPLAFLYS